MKNTVILAALALTGCANFDAERFNQALTQAYQIQNETVQNNALLNQRMRMQTPSTNSSNMMVLTGFLRSQNVNGTLRYCTYSNGVVTTIASVELCPMSNN